MTLVDTGTLIDVIPEHYQYRDDGCEVSRYCLRCPLPQCKYDDPEWFRRDKRNKRDWEVMEALRGDSLSVPEASARFSVSQRTIFRILRRVSGQKAA